MKTLDPKLLVAANDLLDACLMTLMHAKHDESCADDDECTCWISFVKVAVAKAGRRPQ